MMIRTQSRLPCRDAQLGEAVLLKSPVSPINFQLKMAYSKGKWQTTSAYCLI
jgi:hypothetical protein